MQEEVFQKNQQLKKMYALLEDQRKEIKAVNQEIAMKEAEIDRKSDEIA